MDLSELKQKSRDELIDRHNGGYLCGGLVGMAIGFGLGGPIGLIGAAVLAAKVNADWYKKYNDDWDRIGDDNCVNHLDLLPQAELKSLERQYGSETIKAAIKGDRDAAAQILNITVNQTNLNINVQNHYHATPTTPAIIEQPEQRRQPVIDVPPIAPQPIASTAPQPVVAAPEPTQLQSQTVLQYEPEINTQFLSEPTKEVEFYNPAEDLGRDPYSALILGVPGAGKGVFLANAVRELKKHHPDICVIGVDPKAKDEELGIWQGPFDKVYRRNILNDEPDFVVSWLINIIKEVQKIDTPVLLIVDELTALTSKTNRVSDKEVRNAVMIFEDYICSLASLGNAYRKYFWGVAQAGQDKALPIDTSVRNQLRVIALASNENSAAVQGLLRTDLIAGPAKDIKKVFEALNESPVTPNKVAVYDGKYPDRWFPMPVLPIYGQPRKTEKMDMARQQIQQSKAEFTQKQSPVTQLIQEAIASVQSKQESEDLITEQFQSNVERIHSTNHADSPKCPIALLDAIKNCQELMGNKWTKTHMDMLLNCNKDCEHECLHSCLKTLDCSIGKFCTEVCKKSDSGAFRQKASHYYQWLESQYGAIRSSVEI